MPSVKFLNFLMKKWWPQAMTDFQRKEISYANEVTVMVTADLAGRQGPTCRRTWRWLSRFLAHFLVFLAFYHSKFTDMSKNWHPSSLYAFRKGERKNEVFPYRHSYVPASDHRLHLSKNTLFASLHSCRLVYIYSGYMACIFLTFCTLVNFLREEEPWEGSEIENLLSWSVCLTGLYIVEGVVYSLK